MAKLVAFYSRAEENYFGGAMKYISVGNTENDIRHSAAGAIVKSGIAIHGSHVDAAGEVLEAWIREGKN